MSFLMPILVAFFLNIVDNILYGLLQVSYNVFYAVARLNLFSGPGEELFGLITKRIYMALSIIMIFFFAYQLILMIIDPDGKASKSAGEMVKKTIISIIAIILMPLLFKYMATFQNHVISNGTIEAFVLGTSASGNEDAGKNIAMMTLVSFYHPEGTDWQSFFDENGKLMNDERLDTTVNNCVTSIQNLRNKGEIPNKAKIDDEKVCKTYIKELEKYQNSLTAFSITENQILHGSVGENMHYSWLLSSFAVVVMIYFFIIYSISIGVRAVKLGFLQIIAPIPLVCNIFKQTEKTFQTWKSQLINTYLELFVRLFVIFFALELIKLIPKFVEIIFSAGVIL